MHMICLLAKNAGKWRVAFCSPERYISVTYFPSEVVLCALRLSA